MGRSLWIWTITSTSKIGGGFFVCNRSETYAVGGIAHNQHTLDCYIGGGIAGSIVPSILYKILPGCSLPTWVWNAWDSHTMTSVAQFIWLHDRCTTCPWEKASCRLTNLHSHVHAWRGNQTSTILGQLVAWRLKRGNWYCCQQCLVKSRLLRFEEMFRLTWQGRNVSRRALSNILRGVIGMGVIAWVSNQIPDSIDFTLRLSGIGPLQEQYISWFNLIFLIIQNLSLMTRNGN